MSTDTLHRQLTQHLDYVRKLQDRGLPPIACAFARLEGTPPTGGYAARYTPMPGGTWHGEPVMRDAVFHPSNQVSQPYSLSSRTSNTGPGFVHLLYPMPLDGDLLGEWNRLAASLPINGTNVASPAVDALGLAGRVIQQLGPVVRALPEWLAERLGFLPAPRSYSWVETLFHLGWHFPDRGIRAERLRVLGATEDAPLESPCPELQLQLGGVRPSPDTFPGVLLSRLGPTSDVLTASASALSLILEALDGAGRGASPQPAEPFRELRDVFSRLGEEYARQPRELSAVVLRLADSFRSPPATEWAGIKRGGDGWGIPRVYVLSHLDADRVVCFARGPGLDTFHDLADRAGGLLPCWPSAPYPAVLSDPAAFARYCDPEQFPWTVAVGDVWNRGLVTDHRGNVERWLGLVFGLLTTRRTEYLDLTMRTEFRTPCVGVEPVNAILTLRGMNLFTASARAIELADLVPPPPITVPPTTPTQTPTMPTPSPSQMRAIAEALTLLDEAANGLARFGDDSFPFAEVIGTWDEWRKHVAGHSVHEAVVALRGLLDRAPPAPHRQLPQELEELWLRTKCCGAGRAATWEEFKSSDHHTEWRAVSNAIVFWRQRLQLLFLYLGVDLPPVGVPAEEKRGQAQEDVEKENAGANAAPVLDDEGHSVLDFLRDQHPVLVKNVDIEQGTRLGKQTVGAAVNDLIGKGLASRPNGERKGTVLTPEGIALADRLRNSSTKRP